MSKKARRLAEVVADRKPKPKYRMVLDASGKRRRVPFNYVSAEPLVVEPLINVGDTVLVLVDKTRGTVEQVDAGTGIFPIVTVRVKGYAARYNSNQLKRLGG